MYAIFVCLKVHFTCYIYLSESTFFHVRHIDSRYFRMSESTFA